MESLSLLASALAFDNRCQDSFLLKINFVLDPPDGEVVRQIGSDPPLVDLGHLHETEIFVFVRAATL